MWKCRCVYNYYKNDIGAVRCRGCGYHNVLDNWNTGTSRMGWDNAWIERVRYLEDQIAEMVTEMLCSRE